MIGRHLTSPTYAILAIALTALAIAMWGSGWFWVLLLGVAFAVAPWFAASRLLDRIDELEDELERREREEQATTPVPLVAFDSLAKAEREHIMRPDLRIVPQQRNGEHDRLAMSREEWAAIERETRDYQ